MSLEALGDRIREARIGLGFTQQDVASALQVSAQAVSKWERGENAPDVAALPELARLLGTSIDYLLGANWRDKAIVEASAVFADVAGFAALSSGKSPGELAIDLNAFFYSLTERMLRRDGVPIKYIGDAMLCVFSGRAHRERAVLAALEAESSSTLPVRIGISSGPVWMGSIGHPRYARPDVLGDTVNAAALSLRWLRDTLDKADGPEISATESTFGPLEMALELSLRGSMKVPGAEAEFGVARIKGAKSTLEA
jgi:transcriptional regulator with XRE-family HTH domain